MGLRASVLGASGYSGGEILRYLALHQEIEAVAVSAESRAGEALAAVQPHLRGTGLELGSAEEVRGADVDICFSCLPGGELPKHLRDLSAPVVVDLAGDHRRDAGWIYGLTEFARHRLAGATRIANPGCYPTATLLALLPFARAGLIEGPVIVDAMSGVSGAGRHLEDRLLLASAAGNVEAYGTVAHRHIPEMEAWLADFGLLATPVSFTPHLVPVARGVLVTARARLTGSLDDDGALDVLQRTYAGEYFIDVTEAWPATKAVAGTNRALVGARVDARAGLLVAAAAIDNLGKGAAGQAVQNANLALGLDESAGLELAAVWP